MHFVHWICVQRKFLWAKDGSIYGNALSGIIANFCTNKLKKLFEGGEHTKSVTNSTYAQQHKIHHNTIHGWHEFSHCVFSYPKKWFISSGFNAWKWIRRPGATIFWFVKHENDGTLQV